MRKTTKSPSEKIVKDIKRATRKQYSSEEKIRIVLDGLRGEDSIAELCRREGISQGVYYKWSKDFMEVGKRRLAGDTARAATTDEVKDLRREARDLKEVVAEQTLELRLLKKSLVGDGGDQKLDTLHLRSWRSSDWLKKVICQRVKHWLSSACPAQRSTAGTTDTCNAAKRVLRINLPSPNTFGIAFLTR
jgi:transposase